MDAVINILHTMIESVDFSPYTPQFQQKMKCKILSALLFFVIVFFLFALVWLALCFHFVPIYSSSYSPGLDKEEKQSTGKPVHVPYTSGAVSWEAFRLGLVQISCLQLWYYAARTWNYALQHCVQDLLQPRSSHGYSGGFLASCSAFGTTLCAYRKVCLRTFLIHEF